MEFSHIIDEFAKDNKLVITPISVEGFAASYSANSDALLALLKFVKESDKLRFAILTDLFAADFPARPNRFEVVYNLLSLKLNKRLLFKITLDEEHQAPSVASLYSAACWYEREAFDMFGIVFDGCPDMRRILTDYGFVGHPLRKDFPVTGHVQVKYDEKLEKVIYEPVSLEQEFRNFDFTSPWQGPGEYKLPGDEKAEK
jgi:NADH-quinone oxidoreductase subunit C